jgi:hypothetical protein
MDNGFGLNWLGNIVGNSGIGTVDENPETDLKCRGNIQYMERTDNQLIIDTETAWVPMLKMWVKLLDKYLPDAELIYSAEESGCCIHNTNDPCLIDKYYIDSWEMEDIESNFEATESEVRKMLQKLLEANESDINKLLKMFRKSEYSENMSINRWDFSDVYSWN